MNTIKECQLSISINGQSADHQPIITGTDSFVISKSGEQNAPDALLKLDDNHGLVIQKTGDVDVILERGNRKRTLDAKPIQVFINDIVRVGDVHIEILHIKYLSSRLSVLRNPVMLRVIASSAAALSLFFVGYTGCSKEVAPANTAVQESSNEARASEIATNTPEESAAVPAKDNAPNEQAEEPVEHADVQAVDAGSHCEDGVAMCLNNNRYLCVDKSWKLLEKCHSPAECRPNYDDKLHKVTSTVCNNAEPCNDGQYTCSPAVRLDEFNSRRKEIYKCKNQKWELDKVCEDSTSCYIAQDTKPRCEKMVRAMGKIAFGQDCDRNQEKCDSGNAIMNCKNGFWRYKEICDESQVCKQTSENDAACVKPD